MKRRRKGKSDASINTHIDGPSRNDSDESEHETDFVKSTQNEPAAEGTERIGHKEPEFEQEK